MNIGRFTQSKLIRFFFPANERAKYRALSRTNVISAQRVAARDLCLVARKIALTREGCFQGKRRENYEIRIGRHSNPVYD